MTEYKLTDLRDDDVVRNLAALVTRDRTSTAMLLAYVAELDARKLHVPAGYPSMFAYCTEELHMSEDVACKRIAAARAARKFPMLYRAIAEGRLHVSGVTVLAHHFTTESVDELIKAATHLKKSEIEEMIARRSAPAEFATSIRPSVPATIRLLPASLPAAYTTITSTRSPRLRPAPGGRHGCHPLLNACSCARLSRAPGPGHCQRRAVGEQPRPVPAPGPHQRLRVAEGHHQKA